MRGDPVRSCPPADSHGNSGPHRSESRCSCQRPVGCPRWWPRKVLAVGHLSVGSLASGAVGEAVAVAGGGDDVGVVAKPVE
jgi:hypothetical protein